MVLGITPDVTVSQAIMFGVSRYRSGKEVLTDRNVALGLRNQILDTSNGVGVVTYYDHRQ